MSAWGERLGGRFIDVHKEGDVSRLIRASEQLNLRYEVNMKLTDLSSFIYFSFIPLGDFLEER